MTSYDGTCVPPGVICCRVSIVRAARITHMNAEDAIAPARQKIGSCVYISFPPAGPPERDR